MGVAGDCFSGETEVSLQGKGVCVQIMGVSVSVRICAWTQSFLPPEDTGGDPGRLKILRVHQQQALVCARNEHP